jgi:purine-nucleoside phosphorylase
VAAFRGRIHVYEGASMAQCALPVRVARLLGARTLVITASVGALDAGLAVGDLVIASDHINMMGENPLRGWRGPDGTPPFVDLKDVYDPGLAELAVREAEGLGLPVTRGVYLAVSGPSYETPAEMEFMRRAGGTVVGMSVVPEAISARALGMRVLALLTVTNASGEKVSHHEVVMAAQKTAGSMGDLIGRVVARIAQTP